MLRLFFCFLKYIYVVGFQANGGHVSWTESGIYVMLFEGTGEYPNKNRSRFQESKASARFLMMDTERVYCLGWRMMLYYEWLVKWIAFAMEWKIMVSDGMAIEIWSWNWWSIKKRSEMVIRRWKRVDTKMIIYISIKQN